jgi:ribosomal protein S3
MKSNYRTLCDIAGCIYHIHGQDDKNLEIQSVDIKWDELQPDKIASITINTSRPGLLIGKGGRDINALIINLHATFGYVFEVNFNEVEKFPIFSEFGKSLW